LIPFELIGGTPVDAYKGTPQAQSHFLWHHGIIKRNQPRH